MKQSRQIYDMTDIWYQKFKQLSQDVVVANVNYFKEDLDKVQLMVMTAVLGYFQDQRQQVLDIKLSPAGGLSIGIWLAFMDNVFLNVWSDSEKMLLNDFGEALTK